MLFLIAGPVMGSRLDPAHFIWVEGFGWVTNSGYQGLSVGSGVSKGGREILIPSYRVGMEGRDSPGKDRKHRFPANELMTSITMCDQKRSRALMCPALA